MKPISVATRGMMKFSGGLPLATRGFIYPARITEEVVHEILDWINDHRYEQRWHGQVGVQDLITDLLEVEILQVPRWAGQRGVHSSGPVPLVSATIENRRWAGERGVTDPLSPSEMAVVIERPRWSGQIAPTTERRASSAASTSSRQRWAGQRASKRSMPSMGKVEIDEN